MIDTDARSISAITRLAFDGLTGYGRGGWGAPASANPSASPSFAQQIPTAPRSICHFAIAGDLCVFACGRSRMPADEASCCTRSMLRITRAWSIRTWGVGRSASRTTRTVSPRKISRREKPWEPRGRHGIPGKDRVRVGEAEMPHDDFSEHVAEVGGHREVAAVVPVINREPGPSSVHAPAEDAAADDHHRVAVP